MGDLSNIITWKAFELLSFRRFYTPIYLDSNNNNYLSRYLYEVMIGQNVLDKIVYAKVTRYSKLLEQKVLEHGADGRPSHSFNKIMSAKQ